MSLGIYKQYQPGMFHPTAKKTRKLLPRVTCLRWQCGESWQPRVEHPVQCPRCKSVKWFESNEGSDDEEENV